MKQTLKKLTGLFLPVLCMLMLFVVPAQAAELDDATKDNISQSLTSFLETMNNMSREEMEAQIEGFDSVFLNTMAEKYYETLDEIGAYKEIISTEVEVSEDGKSADVRIKAAFEQYDATISAKCYYTVTNATGYDDLWSSFNVDIDYPMSVLMKQAGLNTLMGICIVFFMLVFLSFIISLFKYVNKIGASKENVLTEVPKAAPAVPAAPVPAMETSGNMSEDEITAVIAAAIAAYEEENGSGDGYVVRSIKKVSNKSWKRA